MHIIITAYNLFYCVGWFLESEDSQRAENAGRGWSSLEEVYGAVVMVISYRRLALFLDSWSTLY